MLRKDFTTMKFLTEIFNYFFEPFRPGLIAISMAVESYQQSDYLASAIYFILGIVIVLLCAVVYIIAIHLIHMFYRQMLISIRTKTVKQYDVTGIVKVSKHKSHFFPSYILVNYDNLKERFYGESLFNQYNQGDSISLILVENLDKNGHILERTLELPE